MPSTTSLYDTLSLDETASASEIKLAYRRLALLHHPDKLANASPAQVAEANEKFQEIGRAYTVLKDEKRRERYDRTGSTDEAGEDAKTEEEWKAYFKELWTGEVNAQSLDEFKEKYQGSDEELQDIYAAYEEGKGSLDFLLLNVMCSTAEDEPRFVSLVNAAIGSGELKSTPRWTKSSTDKGAKLARERKANKEAKEAEEYAKELGIHDKLYGTPGAKGKGKGKKAGDDEEGLRALIMANQQKRADRMDSLVADLEAKYAGAGAKEKGGAKKEKRKSDAGGPAEEESGKKGKKSKQVEEPSEEEFQRIQAEMEARRKSNGSGSTAKKASKKK